MRSLVKTPARKLVKAGPRSIAIAAWLVAIAGVFIAFFVLLLFVLPRP